MSRGAELKNTTKNSGGPMAAGAVTQTVKKLPLDTSQALSTHSTLLPFPAELRLLASCHMYGPPLFFVVFLSSAPIKTYP
jgi:hypothetical protein